MTERPRRKWAEIQVELFQDTARRHETAESAARFEALLTRLLPPVEPTPAPPPCRRDGLRGGAGRPTDPD